MSSINYLNRLPPEIVSKNILVYIPTAELPSVFASCQALKNTGDDPLLWHGRIHMALRSDCPDNLTFAEHVYKLDLLAKTLGREEVDQGEQRKTLLANRVSSEVAELILGYVGTIIDEREVLRLGSLLFQAKKLYSVLTRPLIHAINAFGEDNYRELPTLELQEARRLGARITVFNLKQEDLVDHQGNFCSIMKGVQDQRDRLRFISIAINTLESRNVLVLTFFERSFDPSSPKMVLGKDTGDLPPRYRLGSNMVSEEDIKAAVRILSGTHESIQVSRRS